MTMDVDNISSISKVELFGSTTQKVKLRFLDGAGGQPSHST